MKTHMVIERKGTGIDWEVVAHPANDLKGALAVLEWMRQEEAKKRYRGKLRLVRVTRETIEPPNASFRGGPKASAWMNC